jgi:hypothetical protein
MRGLRSQLERLRAEGDRRAEAEEEVRKMLKESEARCHEMERTWIEEQKGVGEELGKLREWNEQVKRNVDELERRCATYKRENEEMKAERAQMKARVEDMEKAVVRGGVEMGESLVGEVREMRGGEQEEEEEEEAELVLVADYKEPALAPANDSSDSDSDDDVKSIEWVASTVSASASLTPKSAAVLKQIGSMPKVQIESPRPATGVLQKASPKRKSPGRKGSPGKKKGAEGGAGAATPLSPPIPPRPRRKEGGAALDKLAPPEPPRPRPSKTGAVKMGVVVNKIKTAAGGGGGGGQEEKAAAPTPFVVAGEVPSHLVVTSELQDKYKRENTPERKGGGRKKGRKGAAGKKKS